MKTKKWASRLRNARLKAKVSQESLSSATHIPTEILVSYERNDQAPTAEHKRLLDQWFNLKSAEDYPISKAYIPTTLRGCFNVSLWPKQPGFFAWARLFGHRFFGAFRHSAFVQSATLLMIAAVMLAYWTNQFISEVFFMSAVAPLVWLLIIFVMTKEQAIDTSGLVFLFVVGGLGSIGLLYVFRDVTGYPEGLGGDVLTGVLEEAAKLIIVFFALKRYKVITVKGGLLVGFAIGAGFDVFETADYAVMVIFDGLDYDAMYGVLWLRGLYAMIGIGHHFWTAILAGTLVYVKQTRTPRAKDLGHPVLIQMFLLIAVIHAMWNFTIVSFPLMSLGVIAISFITFIAFYRLAEQEERYNGHRCLLDTENYHHDTDPWSNQWLSSHRDVTP